MYDYDPWRAAVEDPKNRRKFDEAARRLEGNRKPFLSRGVALLIMALVLACMIAFIIWAR